MNSYEDEEQENSFFPPVCKSFKGRHRSRLGRRNQSKETVTHPLTSSRSLLLEAKQGEALRDIANILQEPNPVLNDSFISDSSSTGTDTKSSNLSESFKTPGRSFYLPCIEDSPLDPLQGILESPRESPLTLFYSPAVTAKKNSVQKTLFGQTVDPDKSFGVTRLDEKKTSSGESKVNYNHDHSLFDRSAHSSHQGYTTHPPFADHNQANKGHSAVSTPVGLFRNYFSIHKGNHQGSLEKSKQSNLSNELLDSDRRLSMSTNKNSHETHLYAAHTFSNGKDKVNSLEKESAKSEISNKNREDTQESLTDTQKEVSNFQHTPKGEAHYFFSNMSSQKQDGTPFHMPFLKPTPAIDQIAKNISAHFSKFSTQNKDSESKTSPVDKLDSIHKTNFSLDRELSEMNLRRKINCTPSSGLIKTSTHPEVQSSNPLMNKPFCESKNSIELKEKKKDGTALWGSEKLAPSSLEQRNNILHSFRHPLSANYKERVLSTELNLNNRPNRMQGSIRPRALSGSEIHVFATASNSYPSVNRPTGLMSFSSGEKSNPGNHLKPLSCENQFSHLTRRREDHSTKGLSTNQVYKGHSTESYNGNEKELNSVLCSFTSGSTPTSFSRTTEPSQNLEQGSSSSLSSLSNSYTSVPTTLVDEPDSVTIKHSDGKAKPFCNSLFQASVLKHESSILEAAETPGNVGSLSSLFRSSIIKNDGETKHPPLQIQDNHFRNSGSLQNGNHNQFDSILKQDLIGKVSDKRPFTQGEGHRNSNWNKPKDDAVFKKPLPEKNNEIFRKPTSVPPRSLKQYSNLPDKVHVNGVGYRILSLLGQGGSSKVYLALGEGCQLLAIKCVNLQSLDEIIAKSYLNEINLLDRLQGFSSVIKLITHEYREQSKELFVVMEKGDIDLANLIKSINKTKKISISMITYYWIEMLNCVNDIHANGVIHSDLKPANFLLVEGRLKLIDFGIASPLQEDMTSVMKDFTTGTFNYMSPESITSHSNTQRGHKLSLKSDIWSLGCILYQLLYGKTPYSHITSILAKMHAIADPMCQPAYPNDLEIPASLNVALRWCLNNDPKKRPTCKELLELPYFTPHQSSPRFSEFRFAMYSHILEMFPHCSVKLDQ